MTVAKMFSLGWVRGERLEIGGRGC